MAEKIPIDVHNVNINYVYFSGEQNPLMPMPICDHRHVFDERSQCAGQCSEHLS